MIRPIVVVSASPFMKIEDGRHPCLDPDKYIPNSCTLGHCIEGSRENGTFLLLTGANMVKFDMKSASSFPNLYFTVGWKVDCNETDWTHRHFGSHGTASFVEINLILFYGPLVCQIFFFL